MSFLAKQKLNKAISILILIALFIIFTTGYVMMLGDSLDSELLLIRTAAGLFPIIILWGSSIIIPTNSGWGLMLVWSFVGSCIAVLIYYFAVVVSVCAVTNDCP